MQKDNIQRLSEGLHTDNSYIDTPKGTYKFALNTVNETELGDSGFIGNEESNEPCGEITDGYTPIGQVYIGDNKTVIFSVSANNLISEIGIRDADCGYTVHVNDTESPTEKKLNFKVTHQIDATYRLRRGCGRTLYWVDGENNKPLTYNLDTPEKFQTSGEWDITQFELIKSYDSVPVFNEIKVNNTGGQLNSGSYNIGIQYLDADLNPTEWITTSEVINIYVDSTNNDYLKIRGSINSETDYLNFPRTTKSILVTLDNLDDNFLFYRLAFIEATNGTGQINKVTYSNIIDTKNTTYLYTGENYETIGTEEEILTFTNIITSAGSIEQVENKLLLANTTGKQVDYCKLQKYASKIKTDMYTKKVYLNDLDDEDSPKNPLVHLDGVGYMPGEIYSLGIVYVFADGSVSPVYHIPGKPNTMVDSGDNDISNDVVFEPGVNTYPMSSDNQSINNQYIDNETCGNGEYWGWDSEGNALKNTSIRHHRFPMRKDLDLSLVTEEESNSSESSYYQLHVYGEGGDDDTTPNLDLTCQDDDTCFNFKIEVIYEVDGVTETMMQIVNKGTATNPFNFDLFSPRYTTSNITVTSITSESFDSAGTDELTGWVIDTDIFSTVEEVSSTSENRVYSTEIFGLKFSGVETPVIENEEITGYYIVRQERTEIDKTILDSGVLVPSITNKDYISHGLLGAEMDYYDWKIKSGGDESYIIDGSYAENQQRYSKRVFGLIHPEHKFEGKEYSEVSKITQHGAFDITRKEKSRFRYRDVLDGTTYDKDHHSDDSDDDDGWSLKCITRDNKVEFIKRYEEFDLTQDDIEEIFYLNSMQSRDIKDDADEDKFVFNIATDNKVGFVQTKEDVSVNPLGTFPYVYLERELEDNYGNFRTTEYYKISENIETESVFITFGGDTYVSPLRYSNTMLWDNRVAFRETKVSWWQWALSALLIVVAVFLAAIVILASDGLLAPAVINLLTGLALGAGGGAFLMGQAGASKDAWNKAYGVEYRKGLRETNLDNYSSKEYEYTQWANSSGNGFSVISPEDDTIQWIGDTVTDLWFESQLNLSLRHGMSEGTMELFLDAPGFLESSNNFSEEKTSYQKIPGYNNNVRILRDMRIYPETKVDTYFAQKLVFPSPDRADAREFMPPSPEMYLVNTDYHRMNKQKVYNHLPIEYDCCSSCKERFPHRVYYSEQSFQEELTDNFKVFLPNNYRDIEGETGEITDLFKIQNNLYIHTKESLWHLVQNFQERVTNEIVSFIGTGEYFNIPPRKIVDENKASGGTEHRWATLKTKHGVFFVSEKERKIYRFNGNELKAISDLGNSSWFKKNIRMNLSEEFNGEYPFDNNPSNKYGSGFISTYDTEKERFILTKKDYTLIENLLTFDDFKMCINEGIPVIFDDYQATIDSKEAEGWSYMGIIDCEMKFQKTTFETITEEREVITSVTEIISSDADIILQLDTSSSFDSTQRSLIKQTVIDWAASMTDWEGNLYIIEHHDGPTSEGWVKNLKWALYGTGTAADIVDVDGVPATPTSDNIICISFVNEAYGGYHDELIGATIPAPNNDYTSDYLNNKTYYDNHIANGKTFRGLIYPIVMTETGSPAHWHETNAFLQHVYGALKGSDYTGQEQDAENSPQNLFAEDWALVLDSLGFANPYPEPGLEDYGWSGIFDRGWNGTGDIIDSETFGMDMNSFLTSTSETTTTIETVYVDVEVPTIIYDYVYGRTVPNLFGNNKSWTTSFSLKRNYWVSLHSYMPNFYYYLPEKFFSWIHGDNNFWKHGALNSFQTFYGNYYPHIIEYVSLSNSLITRVWNHIKLLTKAKKYDSNTEQYYEDRFTTFNKAVLFNDRQCSGELELVPKDTQNNQEEYFFNQVVNNNDNTIIIDKNEKDWSINDLRDKRVNYEAPIWDTSSNSVQDEYYIDKVLTPTIDIEKNWTQLESFRDKYLVIRLIFDTFANIKLLTNFSVENEQQSFR